MGGGRELTAAGDGDARAAVDVAGHGLCGRADVDHADPQVLHDVLVRACANPAALALPPPPHHHQSDEGGDGMGWSPQYTPLGVFGTTEGSRMARATACRMIRSIAESCGNQEQSGSDAVHVRRGIRGRGRGARLASHRGGVERGMATSFRKPIWSSVGGATQSETSKIIVRLWSYCSSPLRRASLRPRRRAAEPTAAAPTAAGRASAASHAFSASLAARPVAHEPWWHAWWGREAGRLRRARSQRSYEPRKERTDVLLRPGYLGCEDAWSLRC